MLGILYLKRVGPEALWIFCFPHMSWDMYIGKMRRLDYWTQLIIL